MNNGKFKSFMERFKKNMFIFIIVWIAIAILFVAPVVYTRTESIINNENLIQAFQLHFVENIFKFPITMIFEEQYINDFIKGMEYYTLGYWLLVIIGIYKALPKGDFDKIEHGSSDWCQPGEQYKVLSKKEGMILAKDNYLPVNKPGNVNVLIVGRIWCW